MDYLFQVKVEAPDGLVPDDIAANVLASLREHVDNFVSMDGSPIVVAGISVQFAGVVPDVANGSSVYVPGPDGLPQNEDASCSVCSHARTEHGALKGAHGEDGCRHPGCNCILTHGF